MVLSLNLRSGIRTAFLGYKPSSNISDENLMKVAVGRKRDQMSPEDKVIFKKSANNRRKRGS